MIDTGSAALMRLGHRVGAARAVVTVERLYAALWPVGGVLGLFLLLTLFDLWQLFPAWLHALILLAFAAAIGWLIWRARGALAVADGPAGLARLERDSGIRHQALRALGDRLPEQLVDPATRVLWERHRERLLERVRGLKLRPPRSDLPRRDPWALRALLLLLLVVGLVDARGELGTRFLGAFTLHYGPTVSPPPPRADLWITPPAYTHRAPLGVEQTRGHDHLSVPAGSEALAQVHNVAADALAKATLGIGAGSQPFKDLGGGSGEVRAKLAQSGRLVIKAPDGSELAAWNVVVIPDRPPTAAFGKPPQPTVRGALRLDVDAKDDYGVSEVALQLAPQARPAEIERFSLLKPQAEPATLETSTYLDLTAHPLAGLPVILRLEAVDGLGQKGLSEPVRITLPERRFNNPLARAIIEQRKALAADPAARDDVADRLDVLSTTDLARSLSATVPLSLMVAADGARAADTAKALRGTMDLLWELALYIEDGSLSTAERDLRAAQEQLRQALMSNASDAELEKLTSQLQEALDRYLTELSRQAQQQQAQQGQQQTAPIDPSQLVDRKDLQSMLDRARDLMRSGARDAAQQLLSQLQQMLENLQAATGQMQPSPSQQSLADLQKMIQLQQGLLDRSYRMQQGEQGQSEQDGEQGQKMPNGGDRDGQMPDSPGRAAAEQEGLRRALGELMRRMGEQGMQIPRALGQAELQMRGARDALKGGQPADAVPSQSQALDLMQQGGQAMLEQMQRQAGNGPGQGENGMRDGRRGRDPLGRAQFNDGGFDPNGTQVPEEAELGRARHILEELYKRSGERDRAPAELDYYRRLLDRF
jgi:uncharacterized protein (TIGR02302 family)